MKKVMLILALMLSVMSVNAQFVEYKPVYTNPPAQQYSVPSFGLEMPQMPQPTEEYTDVGAYYIKNLLAELKNRLKISIFLWRKKLCISLIFSNFVVSNYKVIYFTLCTTCMQIS